MPWQFPENLLAGYIHSYTPKENKIRKKLDIYLTSCAIIKNTIGKDCIESQRSAAGNIRLATNRQNQGGQLMTLDPETVSMVQAMLLAGAAALAIAKITRQCSAEGLRRRLRFIETELFEFARLGHVGFDEPAYVLLRDSLRSIAWASQDFGLARAGLALLQGHDIWRSMNLQRQTRVWEEALDQVADLRSKMTITDMHRRMLRTVWAYLALGAIPFAAWFCNAVVPVLARLKERRAPMRKTRLIEAYACTLTGLPIR